MKTALFSRFKSTLIGLLLLLAFTSVQAATDSLGTWGAKNFPLSNYNILGMAYGNNTYVIVGAIVDSSGSPVKGFVATSPDATDTTKWIIRSTGSATSQFNSVIFSKDRFIAVCKQPDGAAAGNARIWTSDTNGTTWVTKDSDNAGVIVPGGLHSVASDGNGKIVAVGGTPSDNGWITISNDNGTTWRVVRWSNGIAWYASSKFYGIGYAKGKWYAFMGGSSYQSSDGGPIQTSWTTQIAGGGVDTYGLGPKVASNGSSVVIATTGGPKYSDDGGTTWKDGYKGKPFDLLNLTNSDSSIVYAQGLYVLSTRDNAGNIWVSENGYLWKRWQLPSTANTNSLCFAKAAFWCTGYGGTISKSPTWFNARNGCSSDYPYTVFDAEDGPPNRIGLPQYRVNTASLKLVLEATLFYAKTLASPLNFKLVYNSKPTADDDTSIGPFGKNWRFRYESAVGRFGQEAQVINGGGRSYTFVTPNKEDLETVTHDVTLKAPDGIFDTLVYKYNAALPLQSFELTLKTSHLTYVYGTPGTVDKLGFFYLKEIKDQFGRNSTFAIDPPTGKIASISNAGRNFSFTYNDPTYSELCTGISIQGGRTLSLEYDSHKNLISIHDMMGYHGAYEYDAYGFLTLMNTAGKTNTFTYAIRPGYETDPIATQDKYLTSLTRPGSKKISYEILDEGETIKRTDAAGQISLLSNKEGQTTSITDPLGNVRKITYNGAKLPEAVTDEKGGVFTYKYDSYGNMTEKTDALGNKTTYGYDPINHSDLTSVTNALSKTWNYIYNSYFQPTQLKTPLNHITNIGYFNNNIHDITDPRGNITLFTFDPSSYGNLTSVSPSGFATSFSYDGNGFHCESITDPNGNVKSVAWDNNDRITTVNYNSVTGTPSYTNTYDAFGQINFTDELDQATSIVRDELGFVTSITDPLGYISRIEYDADNRPIKNTDPLGRASLTTYDKDGRPTVFTDAKGYKITRSYDGVGNLLSFKDKNNAETTYEYDGNNRLKKTTDPLKKVTEITRDAIGRAATSKNARGQTVTYTYDDDGHISGKTCDAPSKLSSVSYIHDANGNITKQTDAWGDTFYVYDTLNRITKITYPDSKVVDLTWKPGGQVATITYPSNNADIFVVSYTYDSFNRFPVPSVLKNNPGTELFGESRSTNAVTKVEGKINGFFFMSCAMTYNSRGQITGLTHPNTNTTYSYDKGGRLTQIQHSCTGASSNNPIAFTAKYSFDPVSNVTSETFSGSSYYQDTTLPLKMAMTYDVAGQLTGRGGKVCGNDADGNITNVGPAGEFKCTYDAENRLTKMETGSPQTTNNTYNADGLRVKKEIVGGATTVYHYLPSGVLLFTTDGSGTIMDRHVYAGSALLATNKQDGNVIHYHGDRQAHVRLITDGLGQVLVKYDYLPYSPTTGTLKTHIADTLIDGNPFTFNGILGVQDEGNGIFLMQQRFYDSASGRFFQRDPLGFAAGSNLYGFGGNNPMSNADPTGKFIDPFSLACYGLAITAVVGVGVYAVVKIKESMAGVDKAKEAEDKAFESFRKNGDTPESYAQNEKAKQARQDANDTTIDNTKKVILNSGIEAGKALVPGASTPVGNLIQNVVVDQIVDNTIKEPALNSPEPPKPQSTEGGN